MCSSKKYPSPPRRGGLHPSGHPPRISIPGGACHTPPPPLFPPPGMTISAKNANYPCDKKRKKSLVMLIKCQII